MKGPYLVPYKPLLLQGFAPRLRYCVTTIIIIIIGLFRRMECNQTSLLGSIPFHAAATKLNYMKGFLEPTCSIFHRNKKKLVRWKRPFQYVTCKNHCTSCETYGYMMHDAMGIMNVQGGREQIRCRISRPSVLATVLSVTALERGSISPLRAGC